MDRRKFIKTMPFWATIPNFLGCAGYSKLKQNIRPNIVYILADDLGYGDLGCYGQTQIKTPNLDRMAAEGMRFTQHYAGSPVCAPSRCCLMTGLHAGHAPIKSNEGLPLGQDDITILQVLHEHGYRTGVIGKWGLGDHDTSGAPWKKGADYFYGFLDQVHAWNHYPKWVWENEQKIFLENVVRAANEISPNAVGEYAVQRVQYAQDLFTDKAIDFIRSRSQKPFFLYLAYTLPHANSGAHQFGKHGMETPDYGRYESEDWPEPQKGLAAMISHLDGDIGKIFGLLKELEIDDNTVVFFSSDNGPHKAGGNDPEFFNSNGSLRGIKRDLYEGGIRVPLLVRWPNRIKAGQASNHISAFWDFFPTACQIAQIDYRQPIDGISFFPELVGQPQIKHDYLYWNFCEMGTHVSAVRMGPWKYIYYNDGAKELYNLEIDPKESSNVISKYPNIARIIEEKICF